MPTGSKRSSQASTDLANKKQKLEAVTVEAFYEEENKEARRVDHAEYQKQFLKEAGVLKEYLKPIFKEESTETLPSSSLLNVTKMRRTNRLANYAISLIKKENTAALEEVEATYLQLQNAKSEIQHLRKEVNRCLQFRSADEKIDLIPEEEFYELAPASISKPEITKNDEHEKRLAQLNWELQQRKELVGTLTEQEARKSLLISDINGKEQRLKSLRPKISALIKSAKPVQDVLGVRYTFSGSAGQRDLFPLLPHELCVLYVQAEAYKEIMDDDRVNVIICGTSEEADKWNREQTEADDDSEDEKDEKVESDDRRARTVSSCLEKQKGRILTPHPMSICINIGCRDDVKVNLHLKFMPSLGVTFLKFEVKGDLPVYGSVCCEDCLFDDLYPDDDGSVIPDPIGEAKLNHLKISLDTISSDLGRPFKFVQQLAGRGSSSSKHGGLQLADALQQTVKLIRNRISSRIALVNLLKTLERQKLFESISTDIPKKIVTEMTEFVDITSEDYEVCLEQSSLNTSNNSSGFYYKATLSHAPTSLRVRAHLHIPASYPSTAPLFSLSREIPSNSSHLKDLEHFVNVTCLSSFAESQLSSDSLLIYQMASLASRVDVLADIAVSGDENREHLYSRETRGRDGELPLKYDGHLFTFA